MTDVAALDLTFRIRPAKVAAMHEAAPAEPDYQITHLLRPLFAAGALTFSLFTLSLVIVYFAARGVTAGAVRPLLTYTSDG